MDLRHYASAPVELADRTPNQSTTGKPEGLWVSVGEEWLDWCRSEEFRTDSDLYEHWVTVADEANLLHLSSAEELDSFTADYGEQLSPRFESRYIDWTRVADDYDGIVISPYVYSRRLTPHTHWYYGWDIASGCIWNSAVVKLTTARRIEFTGAAS